MKKTIHYIVLALLCPFLRSYGQQKTLSSDLKIGDKVPDITIANIINYPTKSARISDFKHKLLILDFWDTYCAPCIQLLPRFDSLQRKKKGDLQILLVTHEPKAKVLNFLKKHNISLPSVTDNLSLSQIFKHRGVPYEVWIKNGELLATTFGDDVNDVNIQSAITDLKPKTENRIDNLSWDNTNPLLLNGNGGQSRFFTYSIITPYIKGIIPMEGFDKNKERINSILTNFPVVVLFQQAFSHFDPLLEFDNRLILNIPDTLINKIKRPLNVNPTEWMKSYTFCYNLVLPPDFKGSVSEVMKNDLNRFFETYYSIQANIEKKEVDCLVLTSLDDYENLKTKGGPVIFDVADDHVTLQNVPFQDFLNLLGRSFRKLKTPIINETGFTGPIDLRLNIGLIDLAKLQSALTQCYLSLKPKRMAIDMLVIGHVK